jgi:hypothetical protein
MRALQKTVHLIPSLYGFLSQQGYVSRAQGERKQVNNRKRPSHSPLHPRQYVDLMFTHIYCACFLLGHRERVRSLSSHITKEIWGYFSSGSTLKNTEYNWAGHRI